MTHRPVRWLLIFFLVVACSTTHSQLDSAAVRPEVNRSTHVYQVVGGDSLSLDLRISDPALPETPGVVFLHGGGFSEGHRSRGPHTSFLDTLAVLGVSSASISYRLTRKDRGFGCSVTVQEKQRAVEMAAQDLMVALDWLKTSQLNLPLEWVAAGSSAGAEAALWAGYGLAPQEWTGVISFAGAVSSDLTVPQNAPPLFAAHGACDRVVPSQEGIHRGCQKGDPGAWILCGGLCWANRLSALKLGSSTYTYCSGGHEVCNAAMLDSTVQAALVTWLSQPKGRESTLRVSIPNAGTFVEEQGPCPQPCQ